MSFITITEDTDNVKSRITQEDRTNIDILELFEVPDDFVLAIGDDVTYKDNTGTTIFTGIVRKSTIGVPRTFTVYDHGAQLINREVNQIFINQLPEDIFETVVNDFTDLTFSSTIVTTSVIPEYDARNKKAWEICQEMAELLLANFRTDKNKIITLELEGDTLSSKAIDSNTWALDGLWDLDSENLANSVKVEADDLIQETNDQFAGPGTTFVLSEIPIDILSATVGGVPKVGFIEGSSIGDYQVLKSSKEVTFEVSSSTVDISYTFRIPINPRRKDATSITAFGQHDKTVRLPYIVTRDEARDYLSFYINRYKDPLQNSTWINLTKDDFDNFESYIPNQVIPVDDLIFGVNGNFIIRKVVRENSGILRITVGDANSDIFFYQKNVENRVRQLEEKSENTTIASEDESVTPSLKVTLETSIITNRKRGIGNCFYLAEDGAFANSQMQEDGLGPVMHEEESFPDYEGIEPSRTPLRVPFIVGS